MSLNAILDAALSPIAPAEADAYTGKAAGYIIWHYDSIPVNFADNEPGHERFLVSVHLFAPPGVNTLVKRRAIKTALAGAGFTWPEYTNASDKDGQHHVFECETVRAAGSE